MADPIRISALGRDGKVGDFYNYFTDAIVPSSIDVPNERKSISKTVEIPTFEFFYQQPEKFKSLLLGINSHLLQNINKWSASNQQLWFSDYLNTNSMDGDERHAQVTLLFRVVRRTEALDPDFLRSKIDDYQLKSGEVGASHVIDQVVYGAEVICSMRKALDSSQETKEATEVSMYLAAKTYLDETIMKSSTAELPVELDQVSLTCLSSLEPGKKYNANFDSLNRYLQRLLNTEENQVKWKPIDFLIRYIPFIKIEAQLWSERKTKIDLEKERHQVTKEWMMKYIHEISNNPLLKRFPLLEKHVCHFQHLVTHFWKKVEETYKTCETLPPEKALEKMLFISDYLNKIIDWFAYRRKNIQEIGRLLSGTDFALLNSEEIQDRMTSKDYKMAKLFTLNVEYKHDPLVNGMEKLLGQETSTALLPVLTIFSCDKERLKSVCAALSEFANAAKLSIWGSGYIYTSYYIGLDSKLNDATVGTVDYSYQPPRLLELVENPVEYCKKKDQQQFLSSSFSVSASLPPPLTPTVVSNQNQQLKSVKDGEHSNTHSAGNCNAELLDHEQDKMDIDSLLSDVESSDGDCSREKTGSTKIKSSTKDSVETSITSKNQIEPQKSEQNSPTAQVKLYGANVTEQQTSIHIPVQKNCNNYGSMERNSIVNKTSSICEGDAKTSVVFPSQAEGMTQHWDKRDGIGGGRGNGSSFSVSASLPRLLTPTVFSNQNQQLKSVKDGEHSNTHSAGNRNLVSTIRSRRVEILSLFLLIGVLLLLTLKPLHPFWYVLCGVCGAGLFFGRSP
ncbi:hypothetical protein OUZ56_023158 [Daphnia magna]|uniref:Uncharacterized protein n=1 Tax=Daphnia magna TaxID=35525 RepID=A0ABR0AYL7_9CRUS|nr:hypothetical protein OUZ56_023158 [Daphnia magna]